MPGLGESVAGRQAGLQVGSESTGCWACLGCQLSGQLGPSLCSALPLRALSTLLDGLLLGCLAGLHARALDAVQVLAGASHVWSLLLWQLHSQQRVSPGLCLCS